MSKKLLIILILIISIVIIYFLLKNENNQGGQIASENLENSQTVQEYIDSNQENIHSKVIPLKKEDVLDIKSRNQLNEEFLTEELSEEFEKRLEDKNNKVIKLNEIIYISIEGVKSMKREYYDPTLGPMIQELGNYIIFISKIPEIKELSKDEVFDVMINTNNNQLNVVTGNITIKMKPNIKLSNQFIDYPLTLKVAFEDLNMWHFRVIQGFDLYKIAYDLRKHPDVEFVDLEIINSVTSSH